MAVDSYRWLPGMLAAYYRNLPLEREEPIPWTPVRRPLSECRFALVTSGGIHVKGREPPFDTEREEREPLWGDPSFRTIRRDVQQDQIGACHLHINNRDILADVNIVLPVQRFLELEASGEIGSLAPTHYSFMGFQLNTTEWRDRYGPEAALRAHEEGVDAAVLLPA